MLIFFPAGSTTVLPMRWNGLCNGNDAVKKHEGRLRASLPPNGSIRLLVVTEKQYQSIQILLGNYQPEDAPFACEQLSFF